MFIAGEASGDTLGAELVKALRRESPAELEFFGAGGAKMQEAGVELAFDLTAHAVVGIIEVLKNYGKFKRLFGQLLDLAAQRRPDCIVLIDYPGFNLRFAKAVKERVRREPGWNPKVVFYVSPQIWAWHESRIHQIARDIDLLLSIFPFEQSWYAERKPGFKVEFVGHPLIDRYATRNFPASDPAAPTGRTLLLLPGSRERELRKHLPVMVPAARNLAASAHVRILAVLPHERLSAAARRFLDPAPEIKVQIGRLDEALSNAAAAIASSGTVTMECAYFGVPTVVIYRTSLSTYLLGRRFIRVKHLAMPNLLANREIFPELIQNEASAERIEAAARELLENEPRRAEIQTALRQVIATLGHPGASGRAAKAILSLPGLGSS